MKKVAYSLDIGITRALVFGIAQEIWEDEGVAEVDWSIFIGCFKLTLTTIYN